MSSIQESLSPALCYLHLGLWISHSLWTWLAPHLAQPKEPVRVCWPQLPSRGDILASSWSVCMEARSTSLSYGVPSQPQATHFLLGHLPSESVPAFQRTPVIRVLSVLRGPCLQLVWVGGAGGLQQPSHCICSCFCVCPDCPLPSGWEKVSIYSLFNMGMTGVWRPEVCRSTLGKGKLPLLLFTYKKPIEDRHQETSIQLFRTTSGSWENPAQCSKLILTHSRYKSPTYAVASFHGCDISNVQAERPFLTLHQQTLSF